MIQDAHMSIVREIMTDFAGLTGLSSSAVMPRRYLWTDAFAVCNFLELYLQTGDKQYMYLALRLVDQVHNILGRHRKDDPRKGWISGLDEREGKAHPTAGGLRIGKQMNERRRTDPLDEHLEWDRDGQYYHYLTKWMHALNRVSRVTGEATYNRWAMELAKTAHTRFTYAPMSGGQKLMYWKMSIDLSYPLVSSMGQHDPLDGLITYSQIQATAAKDPEKPAWLDLGAEIADMARVCEGKSWVTEDPLGIGGLLSDAYRVLQLIANQDFEQTGLTETILDSCLVGLKSYARRNSLKLPPDYRLPFREFGLSIGLRAVQKMSRLIEQKPSLIDEKHHARIKDLLGYSSLGKIIETFWLESKNRKAATWAEHRDINMVMLATALAPDGYLTL